MTRMAVVVVEVEEVVVEVVVAPSRSSSSSGSSSGSSSSSSSSSSSRRRRHVCNRFPLCRGSGALSVLVCPNSQTAAFLSDNHFRSSSVSCYPRYRHLAGLSSILAASVRGFQRVSIQLFFAKITGECPLGHSVSSSVLHERRNLLVLLAFHRPGKYRILGFRASSARG